MDMRIPPLKLMLESNPSETQNLSTSTEIGRRGSTVPNITMIISMSIITITIIIDNNRIIMIIIIIIEPEAPCVVTAVRLVWAAAPGVALAPSSDEQLMYDVCVYIYIYIYAYMYYICIERER